MFTGAWIAGAKFSVVNILRFSAAKNEPFTLHIYMHSQNSVSSSPSLLLFLSSLYVQIDYQVVVEGGGGGECELKFAENIL
jgi:hypothetical protein